jgi:hypothetical protein
MTSLSTPANAKRPPAAAGGPQEEEEAKAEEKEPAFMRTLREGVLRTDFLRSRDRVALMPVCKEMPQLVLGSFTSLTLLHSASVPPPLVRMPLLQELHLRLEGAPSMLLVDGLSGLQHLREFILTAQEVSSGSHTDLTFLLSRGLPSSLEVLNLAVASTFGLLPAVQAAIEACRLPKLSVLALDCMGQQNVLDGAAEHLVGALQRL